MQIHIPFVQILNVHERTTLTFHSSGTEGFDGSGMDLLEFVALASVLAQTRDPSPAASSQRPATSGPSTQINPPGIPVTVS
jgi:hypothetical protein